MSIETEKQTKDELFGLSPDGYSRFFIMTYILGYIFRDSNERVNVLDVGGASVFMEQAIESSHLKIKLHIVDTLPKPKGIKSDYSMGDGTRLPFEDNSFEAVISTDTLEHIDEDKKILFIKEAIRVSRHYVIIAAPFKTTGVDIAEQKVNDLNRYLFGHGQEWLEEHFLKGKPDLQEIGRFISDAGYEYETIGTNNLYTWLLSTQINLLEAKIGLGLGPHLKANRLYAQNILDGGELDQPSYRTFLKINKTNQEKILDKIFAGFSINSSRSSTIEYISSLIRIIATRIINMKDSAEQDAKKIENLSKELIELKQKEEGLEKIIDSCKPYIKARNKAIKLRNLGSTF